MQLPVRQVGFAGKFLDHSIQEQKDLRLDGFSLPHPVPSNSKKAQKTEQSGLLSPADFCGKNPPAQRGRKKGGMRRLNVIGALVAKLRFERNWTQELLAARLQREGVDVSRDMLANIESGRTQITDEHIMGLQKAFGTQIIRLFPLAVQALDEKYAQREHNRPLKKPRHRQR
jgi:transcriptional regulator with XRE-family HTH domain